jgi:mRNA interferase RelE/StbE
MAGYSIVFARSARRELEDLPQLLKTRIMNRIEKVSTNPRPANVRKLVGSEYLMRLRVGDYRVIYGVYDEQKLVDIIHIRHRGDAYR